jgi:hypothetical protein
MARWTIRWLKKTRPELRLLWAARLFWICNVLGILSVIFLCKTGFERVLMAISWGAITITCVDIVATTDVRDEEGI